MPWKDSITARIHSLAKDVILRWVLLNRFGMEEADKLTAVSFDVFNIITQTRPPIQIAGFELTSENMPEIEATIRDLQQARTWQNLIKRSAKHQSWVAKTIADTYIESVEKQLRA